MRANAARIVEVCLMAPRTFYELSVSSVSYSAITYDNLVDNFAILVDRDREA
jgi:hypothetical protein